ncbi:unnamed protein product [Schistocephalus solidus]|uniref:Uncharacterized protein n=1 Tax=Schistocephalus solidus TaxID=70667 RepID=A0A183T2F8_SCHSO|nr:unnamed protein product [Schistocephalus solidus]
MLGRSRSEKTSSFYEVVVLSATVPDLVKDSRHFLPWQSVLAFGVILTTVGFMCLIISLVMLPTFIRVMYIHSNTVYMPKSAEALQHIPYPRQPVRRKSFAPRPPSLLQSRASTGPPAQAPFSYTHPLEPTAPYPPTEFHPTTPKLPPSYAEVAASYA